MALENSRQVFDFSCENGLEFGDRFLREELVERTTSNSMMVMLGGLESG